MVVKSVGILSVAKIYGAISAAFGLVLGCFFALAGVVGGGLAGNSEGAIFAPLFGVGAIVVAPIFYGIMGLLGGALGAVLYNVFAGMVGGVSIEVE